MDYALHNYPHSELAYKEFLRPSLQQAVELLNIQENFQILDAGCGPGSLLTYFANKIKSGHITAIDASEQHLEVASQKVKLNDLEKIVTLKKINLFNELPFTNDFFDIIWLSDVLFPDDFGNQIFSTLKKLHAILKPGGKIALFYGNWLRLTLLPGHSILEHMISIANEKRKSREFIWKPEVHPENALSWLHECNFINYQNYYLNSCYQYPLKEHIKAYIHYHLTQIYGKAAEFKSSDFAISQPELDKFYKLINTDSDDYILNSPFYHCAVYGKFTIGQKKANSQ